MKSAVPVSSWHTISGSARGASHERTGSPNQDFVRIAALEHGDGAIIAVADGHGDELHARSDRGARFATEVAVAELQGWISSAKEDNGMIRAAAERLPEAIVRAWREKVFADLERDPPGATETSFRRAEKADIIRKSPEVLYGSTLVAAAINERVAAYLQIGDGDVLTVAADNTVARVIPGREDLLINETESLCQSDAQARFRLQVDTIVNGRRPVIVLTATDGYSNSYGGDDVAFFKVATDLKAYLDRYGPQWVGLHVESWLKETSQTGSGDDITIALAWRGSAFGSEAPAAVPPWWRRLPSATGVFARRLLRALLVVITAIAILSMAGWFARDHLPPTLRNYAIEWGQKLAEKAKRAFHTGPQGETHPPASPAATPAPPLVPPEDL